MKLWIVLAAIAGVALASSSAASAQGSPGFQAALRAGQIGERYDGYLAFAVAPSEALRREVVAINIRRRALYTTLAARRGVTLETAALATGCELLTRIQVGQAYMLQDRVWRRRAPGQQMTQPSYCG
jgi:uncharacterized protein YdbL (DUF1318 family)